MQTEEQHGQSVPLRFFEYGQEVGAARERQGSRIVQHELIPDGDNPRIGLSEDHNGINQE
jgi:hypothetical protein